MKTSVLVPLLSLLLLACEAKPPANPIVMGKLRFHYAPNASADASHLALFFPDAIRLLEQQFDDAGLSPTVTSFLCDVWLHSKANQYASEDGGLCITGTKGDFYHADIHVLTPSAYSERARTHIGEKKDLRYVERLLVHEYAAPLLQEITWNKAVGWRFFSAPKWFVQGYEEFLALNCSNEHSRTVTQARYRQIVRDEPKRVRLGKGLDVEDLYVDGAMIVAFMHDHFGGNKVHAVLQSSKKSFESAVSEHMAPFPDRFFKSWQTWLASRGESELP